MKTSNKIIVAVFVIILGGTLTLFVTAKQHEVVLNSYKTAFLKLQPFSVIVAENGSVCNIRSTGNASSVEKDQNGKIISERSENMYEAQIFYYPDKNTNLKSIFKQKGDTLFIYKGAKARILTSGKIKSIIGHQSDLLFLEGVITESIKLVGGRTNTSALSASNKIMFVNISNNAILNCDYSEIENFKISSDSSEITLIGNSSSKLINAKLTRNSKLYATDNFVSTEIEKDKTSTTNISNNVGYNGFFNDFDEIQP